MKRSISDRGPGLENGLSSVGHIARPLPPNFFGQLILDTLYYRELFFDAFDIALFGLALCFGQAAAVDPFQHAANGIVERVARFKAKPLARLGHIKDNLLPLGHAPRKTSFYLNARSQPGKDCDKL